MSGQAASYYDPNQGFDSQSQPYGYTTNGTNGANGYHYNDQRNGYYQQPPQPQQPAPEAKPAAPPPYPDDPPPYSTFDEAFKIDRPKYNDIWAGLLVGTLTSCALTQN